MHRVVSEYNIAENANSNIRVYIRARPLEDGSTPGDFLAISGDESRKINIKDPDEANRKYGEVSFEFDRIFWTETKQEEIFNIMCKPQVDHVLDGFNCCCFAYGQTGSGKTYSMFGYDSEVRGIIPRSAEYLFQSLEKKSSTCEVGVVCSFLEIYNDTIRDLGKAYLVSIGAETTTSQAIFNKTSAIFESLAGKRGNPYFAPAFYNSSPTKAGSSSEVAVRGLGYKEVQDEYDTMHYEIREDSEGNVFVGNLSMVPVTSIDEVMAMISMGLKLRATHETKMNATSSRSHTIFTLSVLQRDKTTDITVNGMLNLVDLAGSERLKKSESVGMRLKEALHINTSLSALGKVIMSLDPSSDSTHIPYRDCKLTRVLQNSLGGNSYTIVLAAIHPHTTYYDECLSTLQFANRCRNVKNNPRVNYVDDPADKELRIKRLQEEIALLRTKLASAEKSGLGGKGGKGGISPGKLVEILKKLGIQANLAADGALMVNGERHDVGDLGLGGDDDEDEEDDEGGGLFGEDGEGGGGLGGMGGMGFGKMSKKKMKKCLMELSEANKNHSIKSKERKALMQEQGKQIEDLTRQGSRLQLAAKHHDVAMQQLQERDEMQREEDLKTSEEMHRKEMDKLIAQYESARKKALEVFDKAPSTFKNYTNLIKQQETAKQNFEEPLRAEFRAQLKLVEDAAASELTNTKKQYEYWLGEKETALGAFAEQFNAYRTKKTDQLKMCEQEIVKLYEYTTVVDGILDGVEKGVYKVERHQGKRGASTTGHAQTAAAFNTTAARGTVRRNSIPDAAGLMAAVDLHGDDEEGAIGGGKGRVLLPTGLRPKNPLKGADGMKLSKKIVEKYAQRKDKLEETKKWVAKKTSMFAANLLGATTAGAGGNNEGECDPYVEQHLRQLLGRIQPKGAAQGPETKSPTRPKRPSTATAVRRQTIGPSTATAVRRQTIGPSTATAVRRQTIGALNEAGILHEDQPTTFRRVESAVSMRQRSEGLGVGQDRSYHSIESTGSPGQSRSRSRSPARRKQSFSPRRSGSMSGKVNGSVHSVGEDLVSAEEVRQMKVEMSDLKAQIRVDQQLIAGISSNEMVQYIMQLEEQNADLHRRITQSSADLHTSKVANLVLTQREGKKVGGMVTGMGTGIDVGTTTTTIGR